MLNDEDMRRKPFILRKAALRKLLRQNEDIQYVAHIKGDGAKMFQAVCKLGLEGIVSKKLNAPYRSGPSKTLRSKLKIRRLPLQRGHWMGRSDVRKGRLGEKRPFHKRTREKVFRFGSCFISLRLKSKGDLHEPKVDCCHFGDRRRASMCAGSKTDPCDQGGRAKRPQNYQRRQGQEPGVLRNRQARRSDGAG